jgi:O-antigen/teichoic acid export membrane protein
VLQRSASLSSAAGLWISKVLDNKAFMAIATNAGWLLGDRLVRALVGFFVGARVARYLGPTEFGQFAYVLAFIAFFQVVANLGSDSIVVRDIARDPGSAPEVLGSIVRLRLVLGSCCWASAVALMAIINPGERETIILTAIIGGILVFQAADTVDLWFQSQSQSRRTVIAKLVAYLLTNSLKIVLIIAQAPLMAFGIAFLLDFMAAALGLATAYRRFPTVRRWRPDLGRAKTLVRHSWPFMLSGLSIILYMRIDQIMLKSLRGDHELGIYAAALALSQIWQMIPMTLSVSLAPFIARKKIEGQAAYEAALLHVFRLFGAVSIVISTATALAAPVVLPLIYGPSYAEAAHVLAIHVFSNVFVALGVAQSLWLTNEQGGGQLSLIKTLCGGFVAIVGNAIAIPIWGAQGAAVVAVMSFATSGVLSNVALAPRILLMQLGFKVSG